MVVLAVDETRKTNRAMVARVLVVALVAE